MTNNTNNRNIISSWVDSSGHTHYNNYGIKENPSKSTSQNPIANPHPQEIIIKPDKLQIPFFNNKKKTIVTDYRKKLDNHIQVTQINEPKPTTTHKNFIGNGGIWVLIATAICIKILLESSKYKKRKRAVSKQKTYKIKEIKQKKFISKKEPEIKNRICQITKSNKENNEKEWKKPIRLPQNPHELCISSINFTHDDRLSPAIQNSDKSSTCDNRISMKWTIDFIKTLDWKLYEDLCKMFLKYKGYTAETTELGPDDGIDINVYLDSKIYAIAQCKKYTNISIGVDKIREFFGIMASEKIQNGFYFTTSEYTKGAKKFAEGKHISLINGKQIIRYIQELKIEEQNCLYKEITKGDYETQTCPKCGIKMVKKQNSKTLEYFWGCKKYPKCKGKISMPKLKKLRKY